MISKARRNNNFLSVPLIQRNVESKPVDPIELKLESKPADKPVPVLKPALKPQEMCSTLRFVEEELHRQSIAKPIETMEESQAVEAVQVPVPAKPKRPILSQDISSLQNLLNKPAFVVIVAAPSGHGKTHMLEQCIRDPWLTEVLCEDQKTEEDTSQDVFEKLLKMSMASGLMRKQVVIENIEGLDSNLKKVLTSFVKKYATHPKIRLVMTSDSAWETPTKTLKGLPGVSLFQLRPYTSSDIANIVID